ncbi:hypothetical protein O181_054018 [Austropuccinia psidii MF-1]|uniref:Uncharacterized protein n=1 Tax=Austropuccinia psidii MF-1 TaxID=1389203 RepID=A0A9Q3E8I1_9BASI|nr:hypothetical protein [Austropuccinia psidii MF-1]
MLLSCSFFTSIVAILFWLRLDGLAQDNNTRNLVIPTTTSNAPTAMPSSNLSTTNSSNLRANNSSTTSSNSSQATNGTNTANNNVTKTPTKPLPTVNDSTGPAGSIPFPASTGAKPNGRYGPDDQYIAAVNQLIIPTITTLIIFCITMGFIAAGAH